MTTIEYVNKMGIDEMTRWLCLLEGIDVIFGELENMGVDDCFEEDKRLSNRIDKALLKYMEERFHTVRADLMIEYSLV